MSKTNNVETRGSNNSSQQAYADTVASYSGGGGATNHSDLVLDDGTNPHGTTKADVGLGAVDNTTDLDKPISNATQAALDLKLGEAFETVSKNLRSWNATLNYTSGDLSSITYTDGVDTITKTFNYTSGDLTSIVLSGDTPAGIDLTKTLSYTSGDLTNITYS